MNCTYRSIWNDSTGTFVAVSEDAKSAGKKTSSCSNATGSAAAFALQALALSVALAFGGNAFAGPAGGVVAAGAANISTAVGKTTINQSTQNAAINWQSFNIAAGEAVQFVQPNSNSVTLNRVLGADPSSILGSMTANGKVFLVNPNGVLFGKGSSVNVGGLVASTLNIADSDFMAGNYQFNGAGNGAVLNQGTINADGGYVALLGANVGNDGVIAAQLGTVALAAGNAITLDVAGDGLLNVSVNQGAVNALAQNGGLIQADGGQVLLTSRSASALLPSAVNNTGVVQAQTLVTGEDGSIMLMGDMQSGTVNVGGTLDASAPHGGNGGFIETSAAHVKVADDVKITTLASAGKTGTWLIDPQDFTIGTNSGDDIAGTTLEGQLVTNSVVISTVETGVNTPPTNYYGATNGVGDINVNDALSWTVSSGVPTTLTLNAARNVNFNANITATGGNLVANAGNDVIVKAGLSTGIRATFAAGDSGNITWTAGNDVISNSAVTATGGDFTICCGRDIKINGAVTTTDGDAILKAGRDIVIAAAMTTTNGNVLLRAGSKPSAEVPGLIGGTVVFGPGVRYTVNGTAPVPEAVTVDSTPASYATPNDFSGNFILTGGATLTQHMLVFAQGNDKVYDGDRDATLSFRGDPTLGGTVTLVPGTGLFDTKDVGTDKPITYTGYSLGGADAAKFALWGTCTDVYGSGVTSAAITPAPLTLKANDATKVYGTTFTPLSTAFTVPVRPVGSETVTAVTETSTGSAPTASVAGSTYPIAITPDSATGANGFIATNYTITYLNGALTVTPAPLVLTANDATKVYGTTFTPAGTAFTQVGLLNSDTVTSVVETSTGSAPTASVAGSTYPIVITPGSATGSFTPTNYTITYVDGKLTVTPAPLTITANDVTKNYGEAPVLSGFSTTPLANDETVGSVTETSPGQPATAPAGTTYPITVGSATGGTFTPSNYDIGYVDGVLTVRPLPVIVPPVETTPIETLPDVPYEGPVVKPGVTAPTWMPVVVPPGTPPELLTLAPPVVPPVVVAPVLVVEQPPVIVAPETPPEIYVAPKRARKQDRN
ncbi:MAG: filamentous hemagglutinin N-terminal domain-containing protein [Rhodoferax sp.]|uniref:two-partner secretion domain-containing protein n=1 Tax=Rhodoferax sp. TaxID=50421 RepID=UPI001400567B|nr:filamentous hemagglutinin N-terminal domain-containing protein [Rhodoferax sp.]NDP38543.1 filamentous hemagglutinin N-terminal domain-containing protein [Rhodoferax sp.]